MSELSTESIPAMNIDFAMFVVHAHESNDNLEHGYRPRFTELYCKRQVILDIIKTKSSTKPRWSTYHGLPYIVTMKAMKTKAVRKRYWRVVKILRLNIIVLSGSSLRRTGFN